MTHSSNTGPHSPHASASLTEPTALALLERALLATPLDASLHRAMVTAKREQGDELGALAHLIAAQTLEAHAAGTLSDGAMGLCNVATGYFMKGEHETALTWYQLVLQLNPHIASAYQNMAAIHADAGRITEAEQCREYAYRIQRVFVESTENPARRILILCVGKTSGNVPVEILMPSLTSSRIKYVLDYAANGEDAQLPPYDLVFNAIGEPDVAAPLQERLGYFMQHCKRPILNEPSAVARTRRDRLGGLLSGLDDVVVAPCIRLADMPTSPSSLAGLLAIAGIQFPVLARPTESHGGQGLVRCDTLDELEHRLSAASLPQYLTIFCDSRSADSYYRKYRMIFVDRQPYPYHLAISPHWLVHYRSAEMPENEWKIAEELKFLRDPLSVLGNKGMDAIIAIGRRLDLDYAGIDFTLLPGGEVLVFEANATMLVHRERQNGNLAHKNAFVQTIVDAFECMLAAKQRAHEKIKSRS